MNQGFRLSRDSPASRHPETSRPSLTEYQRALAATDTLQEANDKLLAELTTLKAEHTRICENGKKLGEICLKDREEMTALKAQNEVIRGENNLLQANKTMVDQAQGIMIHSRGLQAAVDALNAERELLQPLVAVGVATRLRFLEKGKQNASGLTEEEMQSFYEIVRGGNEAGHCGNIIVDTTLFKAKMLDPKYESSLAAAFEKLYRTTPLTDLQNTPKMQIRVENLLATLVANYAPPAPGQDEVLQQHWEGFRAAWEEYETLIPRLGGVPTWMDGEMAVAFDGNGGVCELVGRMEKIGGDIITREGTFGSRVVEEEQPRQPDTPSNFSDDEEVPMDISS